MSVVIDTLVVVVVETWPGALKVVEKRTWLQSVASLPNPVATSGPTMGTY
jgi:hypothetical protein